MKGIHTMTPNFYISSLKNKLYHLLVSIFIFPALVYAGEPPVGNIVSLQEVLENITQTDPSILEAIKKYQSVLAERSIATSEYYPTVGTVLSAGPESTKGVPTNDVEQNLMTATATLFARQNLYNGGKTTAFVDETDARIHAAAYEVLNVANRVYLDCAEAYINVVKAGQLLQIAEENSATQERIMRQVREKTEAGFNRVSELYIQNRAWYFPKQVTFPGSRISTRLWQFSIDNSGDSLGLNNSSSLNQSMRCLPVFRKLWT